MFKLILWKVKEKWSNCIEIFRLTKCTGTLLLQITLVPLLLKANSIKIRSMNEQLIKTRSKSNRSSGKADKQQDLTTKTQSKTQLKIQKKTSQKPYNKFLITYFLFITRKYAIINANLKLKNAKIQPFYWVDPLLRFCTIIQNFCIFARVTFISIDMQPFAYRWPFTPFYDILGTIKFHLRKTFVKSVVI